MSKKLTYEYVKEYIESFNYRLLSKEYINAHITLNFQCNKGHKYETTWNNFQIGRRCSICSIKKQTKNKKLTYKFIKEQIKKERYKLLSKEYINAHIKLKIQCDKGHVYKVTWSNFNNGCRCPVCNIEKTSSKAEIEIQNYIKNFNLKQINNDRNTIINPLTGYNLELDIYLPELNKAIEYNGTYWHSFENVIDKDKIKQKECKKLGIDLLIVNEEKYINNKQEELNKINNFIKE